MNFENYKNIFIAQNEDDEVILKPCQEPATFHFTCDKRENKAYKLFVSGETGMFYLWRGEIDYPITYHTLTDALCNTTTRKAQFSLNVSREKTEDFEWRVYKKVMWKPVLSYLELTPFSEQWKVGFWVKTKNLRLADGGKLLMRVRVYEKKEGLHRQSIEQPLAQELEIPIEQGSCDWIKIERELVVSESKTAFVGVWFEGVNYTGEVYIETPFLVSENGYNVLPDFSITQPSREKFGWAAENLSRKEWPKFAVCLNGTEIFRGERFERIHRNANWEIDIPREIIAKENELSIQLISDYYSPTPYSIKEVRLLEQNGGVLSIIATPEFAVTGKCFPVLIKTEKDAATVILNGVKTYHFYEKGLQVIKLDADMVCANEQFLIECDGVKVYGVIPPVIEKAEDNVITGTGDMIYIAQDESEVEEYLSWYLSNNLGDFLTIRPSYRWSSTRKVNENVWRKAKKVLNEYGIKYVHMVDGRETPGFASNPSIETLSSPSFLGRQAHEKDGWVLYHGINSLAYGNINAWQIEDMKMRLAEENPDNANIGNKADTKEYESTCAYVNRNPNKPHDLKLGAEYTVERLKTLRRDCTRHTGPTVQYRPFLQAGFNWVGLETTYTSLEPHIAFLRGTAKAYGLKAWGVHNAIQWSSTPHDTPERFRRFRLSLYGSYLQGATDINTEEGLWRLEEYYSGFHRLSDACVGHRKQQEDFYRYTSTHSRTGKFYTPMALFQGKYDPWKGFGNGGPCGWHADYGESEKSWQLLKTFYPLSLPGEPLYFHNCPADKPMGYYTGTPKGNIDVLPIEADLDALQDYKTLAFVGYNYAEKETFEKLEKYVRMGGKLVLTRAHRTITTQYEDVCEKNLAYDESIPFAFADGKQVFEKDFYNGREIDVCKNALDSGEVLAYTDNGNPLVCRYAVGNGEVILFNVNAYPAHPAIQGLYENILKEMQAQAVANESVWMATDESVQFAVYNQEDGAKHVYILAVDWYREPSYLRTCSLRIADKTYSIQIPFGVMYKCVIQNNVGAYCHSERGEVLAVTDQYIRVQGIGRQTFSLLKDGIEKTIEIDFSQASIVEISINE